MLLSNLRLIDDCFCSFLILGVELFEIEFWYCCGVLKCVGLMYVDFVEKGWGIWVDVVE